MYETLLALHLIFAAVTFITVVMFSAWAFGAPLTKGNFVLADHAWNLSGLGVLVFGIWLALYVDGYGILDGWILGAIVLLLVASAFGAWARTPLLALLKEGGGPQAARSQVTIWHWLRTLSVLGILVLMVWKPGA